MARWGDVVGSTIRGIYRIIFYGAPPAELMTLFSVWPVDVLVIALGGDQAAMRWLPEHLRTWSGVEEGNMSTPMLLEGDVMLPAPPPSPFDEPPPSYQEAVSSTNVIELFSDDEGDGGDDDCFCQLTFIIIITIFVIVAVDLLTVSDILPVLSLVDVFC